MEMLGDMSILGVYTGVATKLQEKCLCNTLYDTGKEQGIAFCNCLRKRNSFCAGCEYLQIVIRLGLH